MSALWRLLAGELPMRIPVAKLKEQVGEEFGWVERSACHREHSLLGDGFYPCPHPRDALCIKTLVWEQQVVAYCGRTHARCAPETLDADDLVELVFDETTLVPMLQRSLRLQQRPAPREAGVVLGQRALGGQMVRFLFAPQPGSRETERWLSLMLREEPAVALAVVYAHPQQLFGSPPLEHPRLAWLAIAEGLPAGSALDFDLMGLWDRWALDADPGLDLWPRYPFAADPAQGMFWYAGRPLDLRANKRACRLLTALLWSAGCWQSPHALVALVFPDQISTRSSARRWEELAERMRQIKSDLNKALSCLSLPEHIDGEPIVSLQGNGYCIDLPAEKIRWLSEPDNEITRGADLVRPVRRPRTPK